MRTWRKWWVLNVQFRQSGSKAHPPPQCHIVSNGNSGGNGSPCMGLCDFTGVHLSSSPLPSPALSFAWTTLIFGLFPGHDRPSHEAGFGNAVPYNSTTFFITSTRLSRPTQIMSTSVFTNFSGQSNILSFLYFSCICWILITDWMFFLWKIVSSWWQGALAHPAPCTALPLMIVQQMYFE